jgi:hypothetical protein
MPQIEQVSEIRLKVDAKMSGNVSLHLNDLPANFKYILRDKYLNTEREVTAGAEYMFAIDKSNSASFGADRLLLTLRSMDAGTIISTSNQKEQEVDIYPNPVSDVLKVRVAPIYKSVKVAIYSVSGSLVKSEVKNSSSFELKVSDLPSGVYVIKLADAETGRLIFDSKFIKQ